MRVLAALLLLLLTACTAINPTWDPACSRDPFGPTCTGLPGWAPDMSAPLDMTIGHCGLYAEPCCEDGGVDGGWCIEEHFLCSHTQVNGVPVGTRCYMH